MKKQVQEVFLLTAAVFIIAAAVFFFLVPSHCSVSSISGLAIILTNFTPLSVSQLTMALNVALLAVGFLTCGREFGAKTVYTSIMLPAFIGLFEKMFPDFHSLTGDAALDVVCYIFTVSVGLAILFNRNASSGGLDIVAKVMNKYLHIEIGKAMSMAGMCIALSSGLVYDSRTVVLSVLGTYLNGMVLDHFIFDQSLKRRVCIVSSKDQEIRRFIVQELHSGASVYQCYGALQMEPHNEIITIVDKTEYQRLMAFMQKTDPKAFITVYKVSNMKYTPKGPDYGTDMK
ncbi:MAG: YitT family protein [Clostridium sp.]|nr:YitT family protein [Clostridium sp.]